ncbi:hypothetical protein SOVF_120180 [Spinacia oleracea]|nr:hypothetical protein SOVF_120180 [Spinacia oleracea]
MESRRISMALFVVIAIMVTILLTITPSSAQDGSENLGCWTNITNCMGTQEIIQCCPIIQQAIDDERNCFCLMRETVDQNATIASSFATIFSFCSISDSFQTLCPSGSGSSSPPAEEPSAPVEEPSAPVEEPSTPVEEPSAPEEEPSAAVEEPSSPPNEVNAQDQADIDAFSQFLTLCKIPGTFDTLCPAGANNSTGRGRSRSRSTSISGSNKKVAYSVGLLLSSLLLINFLG